MSRLAAYGWDDGWARAFAEAARAGAVPGRVARSGQDRVLVATEEGDDLAGASELPVVGDWVAVRAESDAEPRYRVAAVLPRRSELVRQRGRGMAAPQPLAANADVVLVVAGLDAGPNPSRIDRQLVTVWQSGAEPLVVLTKADVVSETDAAVVAERLQHRLGPHHEVLLTSARDGRGINELRARLRPRRTAALFGASGAGKSALANALLGADRFATGPVRATDHQGRHTTTARHLLPVRGGGVLLDTPGLRSVGLWEADEGLFRAFADIEKLATDCRYASCQHRDEPGCAVQAAIAEGRLDPDRLESWRTLNAEFDVLMHPAAQRRRAPRRRR